MSVITVDLNSLANGELAEKVDRELRKVMENIADPNTDHKAKRKIQINMTFQADEKRDMTTVGIVVKSTLAPAKDTTAKFIIDYDNNGNVVGQELKSGIKGQTYINDDGEIHDDRGRKLEPETSEEDANRVVDFRKQGGTK